MSADDIIHFILVYNLKTSSIESMERFKDHNEAFAEYERTEQEYLGEGTHEVVLIGSDSIDTIRFTHSSYFTADQGSRGLAVSD